MPEEAASDMSILEVLVHTAALRHQLQLLEVLQMTISQRTQPGMLVSDPQPAAFAQFAHTMPPRRTAGFTTT